MHTYSDVLPKKATKPGLPPKDDILPMQTQVYALISFESPIMCAPLNSLLIGSKLDTEIEKNECRLAFSGNILEIYDETTQEYKLHLKIAKSKKREGIVDRVVDNRNM